MSTIKRGKVYYPRLYVPSELRQILHKREVVKSLRTSSHAEAITRSCILKGRVVRLWSALKKERITMTPKQISKLIQQYTKATLEECEEGRMNGLSLLGCYGIFLGCFHIPFVTSRKITSEPWQLHCSPLY